MQGGRLFSDRREGGRILAKLLTPYWAKKPLVLGIPRGGLPVACEVAKALNGELSVIVTKKLPHPSRSGQSIGACAEDGSVFLTDPGDLDGEAVRTVIQEQLFEIKRRVQKFRDGKRLPEIRGRVVIVVDDGIATGSTLVPAIKLCQSQKAARVVVAVPVSRRQYVAEVDALADEVVIAAQFPSLHTVGQAYGVPDAMTDEDVAAMLRQHERAYHHTMSRGYI